jgi:hypothetical protein
MIHSETSSRKRDHDRFGPAVPALFLSNVIPVAEQISIISNRCRSLPPGFDRDELTLILAIPLFETLGAEERAGNCKAAGSWIC